MASGIDEGCPYVSDGVFGLLFFRAVPALVILPAPLIGCLLPVKQVVPTVTSL